MRTLYMGAVLALTGGMLLGSAMKPDLEAFDRPQEPQAVARAPAADPTGALDGGLTYAGYSGQIPDYVLGTDRKRLLETPPSAEAAPAAEVSYYESPLTPDEPQADVGTYTSAVYEAASSAAPSPAIAADAPPEATGDTTPAR